MAIKLKPTTMLNLWKDKSPGLDGPKVVTGNYEVFCEKAIEGLCMKADMCESIEEYVQTISEGMIDLIKMGIPKQNIINHGVALTKILRLGEDMIEYAPKKSDMFFIGLFVELKIAREWFETRFYKIIINMMERVYEKGLLLPLELRQKIERLLKADNYPLYTLYFLKNREPAFKKSG